MHFISCYISLFLKRLNHPLEQAFSALLNYVHPVRPPGKLDQGGNPIKKPHLIILETDNDLKYLIRVKDSYVPLTERILSRHIPRFLDLTPKAREKKFKEWIKEAEIVCTAHIPAQLPNTHVKLRVGGEKCHPSIDDFRKGADALFAVTYLFENTTAGHLLLSDALCGMHLTAIRAAEPSFHPLVSISSSRPEIQTALQAFTKAVVARKHWDGKRCRVKRNAILSYDGSAGALPKHLLDYSSLKITPKRAKGASMPFAYTDTLALVVGANSVQLREAISCLENAAVILLNSASGDLNPTKLPPSAISAYDPEIVARLTAERRRIAALLQWWWEPFEDEDAWARQIVQAARASFGKPDSRYIRVEFDPKKLRDAIRYQVLLSFFDEVEAARFMSVDQLTPYRQVAKDVFDPAPPEPVQPCHAEDPEVFLEIMKTLVENSPDSIVAEGERFVKKDKPLAAWRVIGGTRYLVFLEETWARAYAKAVRARKEIDSSFFQREHWERDLQKLLCEHELIKAASSGYRYRYDLLENGTRDSTYVVAVPSNLLEN